MADQGIVEKLAAILKDNGESVLNGESQLSLSTFCLQCLSLSFDSLLDPTLEASFDVLPNAFTLRPQHDNINFLYDFAQKTIALKVVHHPRLSLISGPVDFSSFRNITSLELKRVPISLLHGLQRVRHNLQTLIISRSSFHLNELFESCGADSSQSHAWPNLKRLFLPFNGISSLDSSLRLLPVLEVMDLSHNALTELPDEFECLRELSKLNVSYNRLTCIPALPFNKLNTLLLRNNLIELLQGVQELRSLENLDLRDNCVCSHKRLSPLRDLCNLTQLMLSGNPISFHHKHRAMTADKLSPMAIGRVLLDSVAFSTSERQQCCASLPLLEPDTAASNAVDSNAFDSSFLHDVSTLDESDGALLNSVPRPKVKGRRQKAVRPKVQTAGITTDVECQSLGTSYKSTGEAELLNVEAMRRQLGSEWLKTLTAQKQNNAEGVLSSLPQEEEKEEKEEVATSTAQEEKEEEEEENAIYSSKSDDTSHTTDEDASLAIGPESDPLIVRSGEDNEPYIITIAGRYLFEKNLDGTLVNKLDLCSLSYFEDRSSDVEGGSCDLEMRLNFDHVKKDQKARCFIMENSHDRNLLIDLLQPIIEARRKRMQKVQCLVCCFEYSLDIRRFTEDRSDLGECPRCHSPKIIKVDSQSNTSPLQSFRTLLATPLATSSAKSSPWKQEKQEEQISEITVDLVRQRQDSTDSDILVLRNPSALKNLEANTSDDYFSTKSISTMYSVNEGSSDGENGVTTPVVGSLTHEAVQGMVQDVYAQSTSQVPDEPSTYESDHGISFVAHSYRSNNGSQPEVVEERNGKMLHGIFVNHEDFTNVDHRLKLFLAMNILSESEELSHVIMCWCMEKDVATDTQPFRCLFVVTSTHQHVLRVSDPPADSSEECGLDQVLSIESTQSLICVTHVVRGLGNQYFSIDCSHPNPSWVIIIKEAIWCEKFLKLYTKCVQETSFSVLSRLQSIAKVDVETQENIKHQVFLSQDIGAEFRPAECDPTLKNFHLVRLYSGKSGDSVAACIATCPTHLCIASVNFCCSANQTSDSKMQQFHLKDRHKIIDIDSVDMPPWNKTEMTVFFHDEMRHEHFQWHVSCETANERDRLYRSINAVFEIVFGVDLNVNLNLN